jgi:uncharacterized membrane protein
MQDAAAHSAEHFGLHRLKRLHRVVLTARLDTDSTALMDVRMRLMRLWLMAGAPIIAADALSWLAACSP